MSALLKRVGILFLVSALPFGGNSFAQDDALSTKIQEDIEQLTTSGEFVIGEAPIAAIQLIPEFYARRGFRPAWNSRGNVDDLVERVRAIDREGLDPDDYHLDDIERMLTRIELSPDDTDLGAGLDILLTESLIRLAYHLRFGKVNPKDLDPNWNLQRDFRGRDPATVLEAAITSESLGRFIDEAIPRRDLYRQLTTALAAYRQIEATGGWPTVPDGAALKPGTKDPRVVDLRQRLARTGDLTDPAAGAAEVFDEKVEQAVVGFQKRHGLDADGVVGKKSIAAMNVSAADRVDQIRVNLERARWVMRDRSGERLLVTNIAGFEVFVVEDNLVEWQARAQVGKPYRKTPVFRADLKYIVFNPTWTVPPTILRKDVLPAIQRDPAYLGRKNMAVLDRAGKTIDPASIDWASYTGRNFPYAIRQEPGPSNALGRVKFIFPNDHFVFLHDTPSRSLFERADRTFSSGCIRVDRPLELAEFLLDDPKKWNQETIQAVLDSKKPKTVYLPESMTVLLLYWTAYADADGTVHLLNDIYARDQRILDGLEGEFTLGIPTGGPDHVKD